MADKRVRRRRLDRRAGRAVRGGEKAAIPVIPSQRQIVFERFFDESGGSQLVIHAPLGSRINRAWGLAMRKRFCRSFDFELQASATDDGVLLSLGPQHSFPIDALFKMLSPQNGKVLLVQALLAAPVFQTRWRWNVTRALAVLRHRGGKKVAPYLQRHRSDDLLAAVFPQQVGCLENHHGDVPIPDHPLVQQTVYDCLHEAMDIDGWIDVLARITSGEIELVAQDTREPSPFSHQIINANPYAFLDDAPLEERRTRAVSVRRTLDIAAIRDLGWLDPQAIAQVLRRGTAAGARWRRAARRTGGPGRDFRAGRDWLDPLLRRAGSVRSRDQGPIAGPTADVDRDRELAARGRGASGRRDSRPTLTPALGAAGLGIGRSARPSRARAIASGRSRDR